MQPFETKVETLLATQLVRWKSASVNGKKQSGSSGGLQLDFFEVCGLPNKRPGIPAESCSGAVAILGAPFCRNETTRACRTTGRSQSLRYGYLTGCSWPCLSPSCCPRRRNTHGEMENPCSSGLTGEELPWAVWAIHRPG
eukprot:1997947-Amphidinium_carterae.1